MPFQCLQSVPFCALEISGWCPWHFGKVLAQCISSVWLTGRIINNSEFFFICLFRWQHDEAGSEPFRLHQRLAHWLSPQSPLRPGLRSRHHSLVTLVILVSGGSTDSSGVCGWSLSCLSELGECPSMLDVFHTFHAERRCCQWTDYELIVQDSIFPMTLRPRSVWAIQ